jgi:hypothetical protein
VLAEPLVAPPKFGGIVRREWLWKGFLRSPDDITFPQFVNGFDPHFLKKIQ